MEAVLSSLGALLVRAVPTLLLLLFLHIYLKAIFFKPLEKALAERKAATSGVKKLAEDAIANAERKAKEYEEALRAARSEMYKEQEAMRRKWSEEQAAAVAAMRAKTDAMVNEARLQLEQEKTQAKAALAAQSDALAEQIAQSVLGGGRS